MKIATGKITRETLDALTTKNGGYTRETLNLLGVPWPPPRGWKKRLLRGKPVGKHIKKDRPKNRARRKSFYKTAEWAKLRYEALKRSDGRCELCGRGKIDGTVLHVDHIKSVREHWDLRLELNNVQVLCATCNWGKGSHDATDWREPSLRVLMGEGID